MVLKVKRELGSQGIEMNDNKLFDILEMQKEMTDEGRLELWGQIQEGYCKYCGGNYLPCYCVNDD